MRRPDTIIIDGRAYSWRRIVELRRAQIEAWKAARPQQPALFQLKDDSRPKAERTATGRYQEPTLLALLQDAAEFSPPRHSFHPAWRDEENAFQPSPSPGSVNKVRTSSFGKRKDCS